MADLPTYAPDQQRALLAFLEARRTVPKYDGRPVPEHVLRRALDLARWGQNHHLTEPWRFYTLGPTAVEGTLDLMVDLVTANKGPEKAAAKRADWQTRAGMLAVSQVLAEDPLVRKEDYAACATAIHTLQLALWAQGVGMKWGSGAIIRDARFYALLGIESSQEEIVALIGYGYPARVPRSRRKALEEVLTVLP